MTSKYVCELLDKKKHNRTEFSCGVEQLDNYLKRQALQDAERNLSRTYVLYMIESPVILGYYSLSANAIETQQLPAQITSRLPRYQALPTILIGRLAVNQEYQGQGLGTQLLSDAVQRCFKLSKEIGAMAVIVDAKDENAALFYEHFGFRRFLDYQLKLFMTMR